MVQMAKSGLVSYLEDKLNVKEPGIFNGSGAKTYAVFGSPGDVIAAAVVALMGAGAAVKAGKLIIADLKKDAEKNYDKALETIEYRMPGV